MSRLAILAARVNVSPREYEPFFQGTYILSLDEAMGRWEEGDGLDSIYGSTKYVDGFNVDQGVYEKPLNISAYLDPSLMDEFVEKLSNVLKMIESNDISVKAEVNDKFDTQERSMT